MSLSKILNYEGKPVSRTAFLHSMKKNPPADRDTARFLLYMLVLDLYYKGPYIPTTQKLLRETLAELFTKDGIWKDAIYAFAIEDPPEWVALFAAYEYERETLEPTINQIFLPIKALSEKQAIDGDLSEKTYAPNGHKKAGRVLL